ncbi:hypothetical protein AALP_AAs43195U000100 [Arabis alpina]|uniref:Uncharacterized protein n=1 Tax=Arabis alpina TaxID=50452 RepID=A0A087G0A7_ARAAL|nr:hypothetical protein AALP_AAs43195U000100 [Arabis alpina]
MDPKRLESVEEFGIDPDGVGRTTDGIGVVAEEMPSSRVGLTMMRVASGILHPDADDVVGDDAEKTPTSRGVSTPMRATSGTPFPDATNIPMCMPDADVFETSMAPKRHVDDEGEGIYRVDTDVFVSEEDPTWTEGVGTNLGGSGIRRDSNNEVADGTFPLNDKDPGLSLALLSSSSTSLRASSAESDDEDTLDEVERSKKTKKAKKKAKINPRGIRHLLGIYLLSRECGVIISTEHLSYLTDFRVRGRSEELKHIVTNSSGMTLITGFPSKDDQFEDRFFFIEISEKTVEADCIDLVKTRWKRRVKPSLPEVSKEFVTATHIKLFSGNGNWRKSFSRRRI